MANILYIIILHTNKNSDVAIHNKNNNHFLLGDKNVKNS